jgi:3-hydroxy acid dehydrogenase / malonic semialdehyde reductase
MLRKIRESRARNSRFASSLTLRALSKIAFVTGSTSGFGKAIAAIFARNGYNVIINGRRKERLKEFELQLRNDFGVEVLAVPFDVRNYQQVKAAIDGLPEGWKAIDILVNNAGLALGLSDIQDGNIDDWNTMIDTNVKGVLHVTKVIAPFMVERRQGHIINIGSIAGKEVYPKGNVYCASKHALDALSKSMRIDLLPHNIKVTSINPGLAETEFSIVRFKGDEERAKQVYQGFTPLYAEDIAELAWFAASRPAHVCINDLTVTPTVQATARDVVKG